eukprot:TRINITY_DN3186_c0_g1_i1.p1 TRINITY_DN3186_c0_g1~~TRINITY_DN3186_c0_g1_i1.p1  ORF type:complete len:114 (-),score=38.83 TRINITY_DN3186_c0_g1_i1:68-409(-)
MAARESQVGIKQLFDAEEKAKDIVAKARKEKNQLLKQARDDAEREMNEYKTRRQKEFAEFSQKHTTGTSVYTQQLAVTTQEQINKLAQDQAAHGEEVVTLLLKYTTEVYTEVN